VGRFVYMMNVSLDLRISEAREGLGAGNWMRIDKDLHVEFNAQVRALALVVLGRASYEVMENTWPQARGDASLPEVVREYADLWTSKPKVLVSRTREHASHNTRVINQANAIPLLAALRARTDGTVGVGGAHLATQLMRAGLLDELLLCTHPVILGSGRELFDDPDVRIELDLLEQWSFASGVTMHRYAVGQWSELDSNGEY
jgi:dihydrofolate reductase